MRDEEREKCQEKIHSELNKRRQDEGRGIKTGDEIRNIKYEEPGRATVMSPEGL